MQTTKWITTTNKDKINTTQITNNKDSNLNKLKKKMTNSLKGKATIINAAGAKSTQFTLKMISIAKTQIAQAI